MADPIITVKDFETGKTGFTLPALRIGSYDSLIEQAYMPLFKNPRLFDAHVHLSQNQSCSRRIDKGTWERGEYFRGVDKLNIYVHFVERELDKGNQWGLKTGEQRTSKGGAGRGKVLGRERKQRKDETVASQPASSNGRGKVREASFAPDAARRMSVHGYGAREVWKASDEGSKPRGREDYMTPMPFQQPCNPGYDEQYHAPAFGGRRSMLPPPIPGYHQGSGYYDMPSGYAQYPPMPYGHQRYMNAALAPSPYSLPALHLSFAPPEAPRIPASRPRPRLPQIPFNRGSVAIYSISPQLPMGGRKERPYYSELYEFTPIPEDAKSKQRSETVELAPPFPGFTRRMLSESPLFEPEFAPPARRLQPRAARPSMSYRRSPFSKERVTIDLSSPTNEDDEEEERENATPTMPHRLLKD